MNYLDSAIQKVATKLQHEFTSYSNAKQPQGRACTAEAPGMLPLLTEIKALREHVHTKDGPMITGPMELDYRSKENARPRSFGVLDLDGVCREELRCISAIFAGAGLFCPTFSDKRGNKEGLRFYRCFYSFNRALTPEEYEKAQKAITQIVINRAESLYWVGKEEDPYGKGYALELDRPRPVTFTGEDKAKMKTPIDSASEVYAQGMFTPAFDAPIFWTDSNGERHQAGDGAEFEEKSLDADWLLMQYEGQKEREEAQKRVNSVLDAKVNHTATSYSQPATAGELCRPDIDARIIGALMMSGLYIGRHKTEPDAHVIRCPWASQHTTGDDKALFYQSTPGKTWTFFCHHTTHGKKTAREFLEAIGIDPAEGLTSEATRKERREAYERAAMARYSDFEDLDKANYPGYLANDSEGSESVSKVFEFVPLADQLDEIDTARADYIERLDTGIKSLNELLDGGIKQRWLVLIAAMAGSGKTALIHQVADNIAKQRPVLFYSLEVTKEELAARAYRRIAYSHNTEARDLSKKDIEARLAMSPNDPALVEVKKIYRESAKNFYFRDIDTPTIEWIENDIAAFQSQFEAEPVIFVDYLQLLRAADPKIQDINRINHVANKLKNLAKRLPVIVISSMNRQNYNKEDAGQGAFKGSGDIEYSAHVGIVITTEEINGEKVQKIAVVKGRDIPTGDCYLKFTGHAFHFSEIPPAELQYIRDWKGEQQQQETKQKRPQKIER